MYLKAAFLAPIVLATIAEAEKNARNVEPCAQITQSVADANQKKTSAIVSHDLAHKCLLSMPFDPDRSAIFLNQVRKILEFQSTIDILKDPPSGYEMPSTDLLGGIDSIISKASSNGYSSQFELDLALYHLTNSAYDGHLAFGLCSQSIFTYNIDLPLVSISTDGLSLPHVYTLNDAKAQNAGSTDVSYIKTINGTDVVQYLESYALGQTLQDRDAQFNRVFPALVRSITGTPIDPNGIWASTQDWMDGSEFVIEYENGTSQTVQKTATPKETYFEYQNGTQLFNVKCIPESSSLDSSATADTEEASGVTGLPSTAWSNSDYSIAGFFSNLTSLQDTGILFVPTFSSNPKDVAQLATNFLNNATLAGKKNILIDVTSNPGGYLTIGIDMARIFFPDVVPYTATRFRAHDAAKYLTKAYSRYTKQDSSNPFAYRDMVTPNQTDPFSSWQDLYGPHQVLGSSSSSLLANFNYSSSSTNVFPINGYGSIPLNPTKSLFSAENIAIITNGDCVSTCASFVKLMKRQGVRTIAFGGRPSESPMQGVGGVKGGQSLGVGYINGYIQIANELIQSSANTSSPLLTRAEWTKFNQSTPSLDASFSWNGNLNLRNEYDPDDSETPLQFIYEAAECRLFYKLENYLQQETVWQAAAKAMFGDGGCVKGSTNGKGSLSA